MLRALKKDDTPIHEGFDIYYNFIRSHQGLEGKTPAEVAGINLDLDRNKRLGLIKKSLSNVRQNGML